jgi:hypothetical protein
VMSPRILRHCDAESLMLDILVEPFMCHHLNHELNIGSKATRSQWVGGYVPCLMQDIFKDVEMHRLHECI